MVFAGLIALDIEKKNSVLRLVTTLCKIVPFTSLASLVKEAR